MNPQLEGVEELEGTYLFDLRASYRARNLNRFLNNLRYPDYRTRFVADEATACREGGLSPEETEMVLKREWLRMIQYGVVLFAIEKFLRVLKMTNLELYAKLRGETFEQFLKTRKVPDAR